MAERNIKYFDTLTGLWTDFSPSDTIPTTAVPTANTNIPISGWWVVAIGGTGGTVQLRQRSEIAASNTVLKAGITLLGYRVLIAP